jgi:carbon storage regulator
MLVVTRKRDERLFIGDDIEIVVTRITDGQVRLAIKAPDTTKIVRQEVLERHATGGADVRPRNT